jgi:arylsulfatase A-like enzyme
MPRQLDNHDFRKRAMAAYDEMVLMTDQYIGMILDELRNSGRYDDTVIIFYSDHGEHMWEDEEEQFGHGNSLDNVLLHVPLMIKFPDSAHKGKHVSEYVGLIDIFSTVLDFSGHSIESPFEKHSLSLKQLVETGSGRNNRELISEFTVFGPELMAIQVNEHRLIHTISADKYRLRLATTDEKINPRKEPGKDIYEALLQFLESYNEMVEKMAKEPHMMKLERNLFKTFRDLGYIN